MDNLNDREHLPALDIAPIAEAPPERDSAFDPPVAVDAPGSPGFWQAVPRVAREVPTLGNTFVFFALAVGVTLTLGLLIIAIATLVTPHRSADFRTMALDTRLAVPSQALEYLALLAVAVLLFRNIWQRPFWQTLHWNGAAVVRRWIPLLMTGVALGLLNGAASNVLPMPKEAPILNDLMRSTTGAWLMFLFGTTLAPLMEELAFRGFLLPSLINFFNWRTRRAQTPENFEVAQAPRATSPVIVPISILLASIPFALLHSEQVAGAWAPVLLIGVVSVVLCIIRLWTRSLAASTFVHAAYNCTLFAGMMIASDGFRHLDKLNS
jgi:hypothetical protein